MLTKINLYERFLAYKMILKNCTFSSHIPWVQKYILCQSDDKNNSFGSTDSFEDYMDDDSDGGLPNRNPIFGRCIIHIVISIYKNMNFLQNYKFSKYYNGFSTQ